VTGRAPDIERTILSPAEYIITMYNTAITTDKISPKYRLSYNSPTTEPRKAIKKIKNSSRRPE
jgi:hypothetical protein